MAIENNSRQYVDVKAYLSISLVLLLVACSEDPVAPVEPLPPVDLDGHWTIVFETGVQWQLSLRQDSVSIQGYVQPDSTLQLFMEVSGEVREGTPDFSFEGYSWTFVHQFHCRMRGNGAAFDGRMDLFDIETLDPIDDFSFYAVRRSSKLAEPAYPPPGLSLVPLGSMGHSEVFNPSQTPSR